ncbi:MAG: winged helix-turn-helix transcriptional regulator [Veillonellaceae bacterium]|nr:winged helix-turn-helix transcriptional regulator [Veillonellaceae bacterium]
MMLTPRQEQILNFIKSYPHQYPPSIREIGAGVGLSSPATVHSYLNDLEQMGFIERKHNSSRCITVKAQAV